ncbi:MAG: ABC transporter substrate-binding protein [Psychromonas sp.]
MKKSVLILPLMLPINVNATSIEVLHWWTAKGEYDAQQILENNLLQQQIKWQNFAIIGEGGESAIRVLQMRALSGNPPDVAQIKGPDIGEWVKVGMLEEIDKIIETSSWQQSIPDIVRQTVTIDGHYMAVPINVHRVNWLWLNKAIFDELKLAAPTTWDDFFVTADKIKAAGYLPLAHGGTPWQDALLFESMALSLLGAEKYKKAFVEHDVAVLNSLEMVHAFEQFKRLSAYTDKSMLGRDWDNASLVFSKNEAAMQLMGDWAKGMWYKEGKQAMVDYICVDVPESKGLYSYNIDSFVFFKKNSLASHQQVQRVFAETLLSEQFQVDFNMAKGSIPVRSDINIESFDDCAKKSFKDFHSNELVPSFTQNLASTSHMQNIMTRIISDYFNDPMGDAALTAKRLSTAIRAIKH